MTIIMRVSTKLFQIAPVKIPGTSKQVIVGLPQLQTDYDPAEETDTSSRQGSQTLTVNIIQLHYRTLTRPRKEWRRVTWRLRS